MHKLDQTVSTLEELALLGEIHKENPFKNRAFANAARTIRKLGEDFETLYQSGEITKVKGVGAGVYNIIEQIMQDKEVLELKELVEKTPEGLFNILELDGVGPKKVRVLWQELDITTLGELDYACQENRLVSLNGFGKKTQERIKQNIIRLQEQEGLFRLDQCLEIADKLIPLLESLKEVQNVEYDGELKSGSETMRTVELYLQSPKSAAQLVKQTKKIFTEVSISEESIKASFEGVPVYLKAGKQLPKSPKMHTKLIKLEDLQGAFHNHTVASDGSNTLLEMRQAATERNLTYLGISDHSKSAFYAGGLESDELLFQVKTIEKLNQDKKAKQCFLLSGVESDILSKGELDYPVSVLSKLDVVIASVHSRLKQDFDQMTDRMVKAAKNPWTCIVGHPTGRLILGRPPSAYNMEAFLQTCKENETVVELNANPHRLDLNAEHLALAKEIGVKVAINADAHEINGLDDLKYGIMTARKAGLSPEDVINCLSLKDILEWLSKRKKRAKKLGS